MSSDFLKFTLESIREGGSFMSWMERRRLEWTPLIAARLRLLLEGKSFIFMCDDERSWYEEYFLSKINAKAYRPLVPIFPLSSFYGKKIKGNEDIELLNDLLEIAFPNGYMYFYIGTNTDKKAQVAKSKDDSLIWLFDEQLQNSFYLDSKDEDLDSKLITLYKLFDLSLDAILFSKVSL